MVKKREGGEGAWNIKIYEGDGWMPLQPYLQKQCLQEYQKPVGMLACRVSLPACIFLDAVLRNFRSVWYVTFIRCPLMVGWAWQSAFATVPRLHISLRCFSLLGRGHDSNGTESVGYKRLRFASEDVSRGYELLLMQRRGGACMKTRYRIHEYASADSPTRLQACTYAKTSMAHADMQR